MAFMQQAGQSKKVAEARLSLEECKTITILIRFFPYLKCVYISLAPTVYIHMSVYLFIVTHIVCYTKVSVFEIEICIFSYYGPAALVIFFVLSLYNNFTSKFCN
jgi:hypothetical protein